MVLGSGFDGELASGVASILTACAALLAGWAALVTAKRRANADCEERVRELEEEKRERDAADLARDEGGDERG